MAKSDKKDVYNASMGAVKSSGAEYDALNKKTGGMGDTTWDRATENYNPAFEGYKNYAEGGGLTQEDKDRMGAAIKQYGAAAGGGGGGGISNPLAGKQSNYKGLSSAFGSAYRPDYGEADTGFRKLAGEGGGFDDAQLKQIYGNVGNLSKIGETGGVTDEDRANINRQSILDQEKDGGYSEQDRALIRAKSAASSPAYFDTLKDNLQRQRGQTGNLANAGAVDFKLARQSAQQQGADRVGAEISLGDSIRTGRESAGQFLSNQNKDLYDMRTKNAIQGAQAAGNLGLDTQRGITSNQAEGLKGLQGSQTGLGEWGLGQAGGLDNFGLNQAGGLDSWDMNNAQMQMQADASNAASSRASSQAEAEANLKYNQWLTEYGNEQKQYGIGGLNDLYNTNLTASRDFTGMGLEGLQGKYGTQGSMLGLASQNRGDTMGETIGKYGKVAGAAALTYMSGGAAAPMLINAVGDIGKASGAGTGYQAPAAMGPRLWGGTSYGSGAGNPTGIAGTGGGLSNNANNPFIMNNTGNTQNTGLVNRNYFSPQG
jgi:hypothetical protein